MQQQLLSKSQWLKLMILQRALHRPPPRSRRSSPCHSSGDGQHQPSKRLPLTWWPSKLALVYPGFHLLWCVDSALDSLCSHLWSDKWYWSIRWAMHRRVSVSPSSWCSTQSYLSTSACGTEQAPSTTLPSRPTLIYSHSTSSISFRCQYSFWWFSLFAW